MHMWCQKKCAENSHCVSQYSLCFQNTLTVEAFREMMLLDRRIREVTVKKEDCKEQKNDLLTFASNPCCPGSHVWSAVPWRFGECLRYKFQHQSWPEADEEQESNAADRTDISDSQLSFFSGGRVSGCAALVLESADNDMDCSSDLSSLGFTGSARDVCYKSCPWKGDEGSDKTVTDDDLPAECWGDREMKWSSGPKMERFVQTIDRCETANLQTHVSFGCAFLENWHYFHCVQLYAGMCKHTTLSAHKSYVYVCVCIHVNAAWWCYLINVLLRDSSLGWYWGA